MLPASKLQFKHVLQVASHSKDTPEYSTQWHLSLHCKPEPVYSVSHMQESIKIQHIKNKLNTKGTTHL